MSDAAGAVLDHNACRNCRRVIHLLAGVGWVHAELPQYAHEPITCTLPVPGDVRCSICWTLQPNDPQGRAAGHDHPDGGRCPGSWQPGVRPPAGVS